MCGRGRVQIARKPDVCKRWLTWNEQIYNGIVRRPANAQAIISKALQKAFSPEFLNRVDDVIMFDQLSKDAIFKIIDIELAGFRKRLESLGYSLDITEEAKNFIAEKGYDAQYGARPLKRAIQKYIEDDLADLIMDAKISEGDTVRVTYDSTDKKLVTAIVTPDNPALN